MSEEEKELFEEDNKRTSRYNRKEDFRKKTKDFKYYQNYAIIIILSIVSLVFLPMLGSEGDISFDIPDTPAGLLIWILSKISVITLNLLIFGQFIKQAKNNVREHPLFLEAERLLNLIGVVDDTIYYHPNKYITDMKKKKQITVLISSILSVFCFGNAFLTFDWLTLLTYSFTVLTSLVFGWITMLDTEDIWTYTYIKYARQEYKKFIKLQEESEDDSNKQQCSVEEHPGTSPEE